MLWFLNMIWNWFRSNSRNHAPFSLWSLVITKKKCSWLGPAYSWNKQLAHTPFPKKINTPSTTLRFIGFVAKISVLNPKLPANGQWTKETKESVKFFIWSPLLDRLKKISNLPISTQSQKFDFEILSLNWQLGIPAKKDTI